MRAANPSHALATVLVDELARAGLEHVCISPGSRSAPLAMAFDADPRIAVHVLLDERSSSFCALGLARAARRPVAVVTTSGTAAANLHPAALEAERAGVPLLLLTADRPPELRDTGAPQTVDQNGLFGPAVRWFCDVGVPEPRAESVPYWRSVAARAVIEATSSPPGPVHLNLAFREPLTPEGEGLDLDLAGRPGGEPWTSASEAAGAPTPEIESLAAEVAAAERGAIVAGACEARAEPVLELARVSGWPLLAEPASNMRAGAHAITTYDALLRVPGFAARHRPDLVVRMGATGISRALGAWLEPGVRQVVIDPDPSRRDPGRTAARMVRAPADGVCAALASAVPARPRSPWLESWLTAERVARAAIDGVLDASESPSEPRAARDLAAALPSGATLVVAASMPVRDLDWFMGARGDLRVLANRGANGIDGFVSTVLGASLGSDGPVAALAGDLSMLHDQNGLLLARSEPIDAIFVVLNNDGGGVFSFLPPARFGAGFERLFATPQGPDFAALARLHGAGHRRVERAADLSPLVAEARDEGGVILLEVPTERRDNVEVHRRVWERVTMALEKG